MPAKDEKNRSGPSYTTLYNEATGKFDTYYRPDPATLGWLERLWYRLFDWLEVQLEDFLMNHHPYVVAHREVSRENFARIRRYADEFREKYPERYAEALAEQQSKYVDF